jgi:osmotically-inducible protein OsmY
LLQLAACGFCVDNYLQNKLLLGRLMFSTLQRLGTLAFILASSSGIRAEPAAPVSPSPSQAARLADDAIRASLLAKLGRDHHLAASSISSGVTSGIVELGGTVTVRLWRERAERIARAVRGVRAVVNRIRVDWVRRPDREVERDIRAALRATAALRPMPIRASVSDGVVELDGWITSWEEQQLAERVASSIPGVRFCQNQLVAGNIVRSDAILAGDIRSRFDWEPLIEHDPIRVDVSDAHVVLSGKVGSRAEAAQAAALAWVKGVVGVDAARLQPTLPRPDGDVRERWPTDSEMSATVTELLRYWPNVPTANMSIAVLDGAVTLRGTVQTLSESQAATDLARALVGVARVDNQLRGPWWRAPSNAAPPRRRRLR